VKTSRCLWHLVRQNVLGYLSVTVVAAGYRGSGVATGLLLKAIFDTITGNAQVGFDVYTLLAFMAVLNLVTLVVFQNGFWNLNEFLKNRLHARLQRNLLKTILSDDQSLDSVACVYIESDDPKSVRTVAISPQRCAWVGGSASPIPRRSLPVSRGSAFCSPESVQGWKITQTNGLVSRCSDLYDDTDSRGGRPAEICTMIQIPTASVLRCRFRARISTTMRPKSVLRCRSGHGISNDSTWHAGIREDCGVTPSDQGGKSAPGESCNNAMHQRPASVAGL
jgi:hypothetical protein